MADAIRLRVGDVGPGAVRGHRVGDRLSGPGSTTATLPAVSRTKPSPDAATLAAPFAGCLNLTRIVGPVAAAAEVASASASRAVRAAQRRPTFMKVGTKGNFLLTRLRERSGDPRMGRTAAGAHRAYPYTGGVSAGTISFARGVPAPECLPVSDLADCAKTAIEHDGAAALLYGHTLGYEPLREWIGEHHGVDPSRVVVTNGSLQVFHFVLSTFADGPQGDRRAADVRPAAEDPRRDAGRLRRGRDRRARPRRRRARAPAQAGPGSSTRSRPFRTRPA